MAAGATKALAVKVIRRLRAAGHEALLAGGCVRDMLLGRRPGDYDVATSATPQQVQRLFGHVLMIGAKFGVAMVVRDRRRVEVATFRSDLSYSDGRRPDGVRFVSAREDALRRDFTINGMFYDPLGGTVVDYVGGEADLAGKVVRAIGEPERRFSEDYLRMLRAARFAARFGFRIEKATAAAIRRRTGRITDISGERIREELEKMFAHASAARAVRLMHELGLLEAFLPEVFADAARWPRALRRVQAVARRCDTPLTFAALLADLPRADLRKIVRRWGGPNHLRDSLIWIARRLHEWKDMPRASLAELKRCAGHRDYRRVAALWRIEERAATGRTTCSRAIAGRIGRIDPGQIAPARLVAGDDLIRMGLIEGPRIGKVLSTIYEAQLNDEVAGRRSAMRLARQLIANPKA